MKKIISICIGFILFLWMVMFIASCTPVQYVNINRPHTYRHRSNVSTVPVWIPGHGVVLQQQRWYIPNQLRPEPWWITGRGILWQPRRTPRQQRPDLDRRVPRKH